MKLAGFGLIVGVVGLIIGVDGLMLCGGLWLVSGLLLRMLVQPDKGTYTVDGGVEAEIGQIAPAEGRSTRIGGLGLALLPVCGFASIAIGISGTGFPDDYESLRWFPFVVGLFIALIGLVAIPVELGMIKPEDAAGAATERDDLEGSKDPLPEGVDGGSAEQRLAELENLRQRNLVTPEEYEAQRERILRSI